MKVVIGRLEKHLAEVPGRMKSFAEPELMQRPAPGKWSRKEIMGHLVDSAIYNILRFTQAQYKPSPYVVEGYEQDNLVAVNDYQNLPLEHLLATWELLNRHIVFILSKLSKEKQQIPIVRKGEPRTLGWLAEDYLNHMEHHLKQIFK